MLRVCANSYACMFKESVVQLRQQVAFTGSALSDEYFDFNARGQLVLSDEYLEEVRQSLKQQPAAASDRTTFVEPSTSGGDASSQPIQGEGASVSCLLSY